MNEIELKIPLTQNEYDRLYKELYGKECTVAGINRTSREPDEIVKRDENYTRYATREEQKANNEPGVIRIRTQTAGSCEKSYFTIKRKSVENGIEVNKENETFVEDAEVIRELLREAGYHCWFSKEKRGYSCYCTIKNFENFNFHIELEKVNSLPYIEIEVTLENPDSDAVKKGLEELVKLLGLDINKRDSRSWRKIIEQAQKEES